MKLLTVIGARPQFIKAATVSRGITQASNIEEIIVHTGQHFDHNMSDVFFKELNIPAPDVNLNINGGTGIEQTAHMMLELDKSIFQYKPDALMVYGDTNSTLSGALVAARNNIPLVHVEAGLRSFNNKMPEEINRIVTDRLSSLLFTPTETADRNLVSEGVDKELIVRVGDVMYDAALLFGGKANLNELAGKSFNNSYILATVHRAENTDDKERLSPIISALKVLAQEHVVVLPLHPRTKKFIQTYKLDLGNIQVIPPVGYLTMLALERNAKLIATDSGGVQKEAFFNRVPCITLRDETEWTELVELGCNVLTGASFDKILSSAKDMLSKDILYPSNMYGGGKASERIVHELMKLA